MGRFFRYSLASASETVILLCLATGAAQAASAVHGAWSVDCAPKADSGESTCVASQKVATDPAGKQVVLGVIVEPASGDMAPRISFRVTNRAYEPAGIGIKVDDHSAVRLPFSACDGEVCEARGWLDDALLQQMRPGQLLRFAFFIDRNNQISYPVSLNGFADAFDTISRDR